MLMALDDYVYCSPFLSVASLDHLLERPGEYGRTFDIPDSRSSTEVQIDRQRASDMIHAAVAGLPPRQRAVIHAIYFVGHTVTQTALLLQISAAAVVNLRTRALKRLMKVLAPVRDALFA